MRFIAQQTDGPVDQIQRMLLLMSSVPGEGGDAGIKCKIKYRWRVRRKREATNKSSSGEKKSYCLSENK